MTLNPEPSTRPPRWSKIQIALLLTWLLVVFGMQIHPLGDPDVYVHMRDGAYFWEHGLGPMSDPFSYTAADRTMDRIEWLFKILAYGTWRLGGTDLLIIFKALLMTASIGLLGFLMYQRWPNLGGVGLLLALAFGLPPLLVFFRERPYLFTYLFIPLVWLLLERHRQARRAGSAKAGRSLMAIPVLTLLWTNLHPGFIVIFVFYAAYLGEAAWDYFYLRERGARLRLQDLGLCSLLVFLAGAANPLGFSQYFYVASHIHSRMFMQQIEEWARPTWQKHAGFFIGLAVAWLAQMLALTRTRVSNLLLLAVFSYLGLQAYRNFPLFYLAALPPLAEHISYSLKQYWPRTQPGPRKKSLGYATGFLAAGLWALLAAANAHTFHLGTIRWYYPEDAMEWMLQTPLQGRMMAEIHWSGYLSWKSAGRIKVFMDGRLAMFGEKIFYEFLRVVSGDPKGCLATLDAYNIQILLVDIEKEKPLSERLTESQAWALVYFDDLAQVYLRRQGPNQAMIDSLEYKAIAPWKPLPYKFSGSIPGLALSEARRAVSMAPHSYLPRFYEGQLLLSSGDYPASRRAFLEVIKLDPKQYTAFYNLGYLAFLEKSDASALGYLKQALWLCPAGPHREVIRALQERILAGQRKRGNF